MEKSIKFNKGQKSIYDTLVRYEIIFNNLILDEFYMKINKELVDIGHLTIHHKYGVIDLSLQYYFISNVISQIRDYKDKNLIGIDAIYDKEITIKVNLKKILQIEKIELTIFNNSMVQNMNNPEIYFQYDENNYNKNDVFNPEIKRMGYMFGLSKQDDYIFTYREKKINQDDYNIIVAGETPYYKFFKIITYDIFQLFQLKYYNIKDLRYREITLLDLYDIEIKKI